MASDWNSNIRMPRAMPYNGSQASRYDTAVIPEVIRRLRENTGAEVCFDDGSRALYATDASNYRQVPIGVVVPRTFDDVVAAVAVCREYRLPVLSRGGGTSLAGQCCNVAVVLDMSKYLNKILSIDPNAKTAVVEPGVVLDHLRERAEQHRLTFAPDPSTHNHNTLGGMIGNNSCGVHSIMGGRTADNVLELEVLTYDGLRMTVGATPEDELERIVGAGGRRGGIYRGLRELRDRYAALIRERMPDIRAGRHRRHLRDRAARDAATRRQPAGARARGARLSGCIRSRRSRAGSDETGTDGP
jgi:FAD/FMN-containing dehydrogenase